MRRERRRQRRIKRHKREVFVISISYLSSENHHPQSDCAPKGAIKNISSN
jgi:hypothetical protein